MGLDMYLNRHKYVGNKWKKPEEQAKIDIADIDQSKVSEVVEEIGYWRKANAIHKWFVNHVQGGDDDCTEHLVSQEKIQELLDIVNKVLKASKLVSGKIQNGTKFENGVEIPIMVDGKFIKDSTLAQELLPTTDGFFFGQTDYNEYYYNDLLETKKILEEALKHSGDDIYYQSSW